MRRGPVGGHSVFKTGPAWPAARCQYFEESYASVNEVGTAIAATPARSVPPRPEGVRTHNKIARLRETLFRLAGQSNFVRTFLDTARILLPECTSASTTTR